MTSDGSYAPKAKAGRVLLGLAIAVSLLVVFALDRFTGLVPDLTVLYLVPIIAATFVFGRTGGFVTTATALVFVAAAHPVAHWPSLIAEVVTHFAVFLLTVLAVDRLDSQLRTIRLLESQRTFDLELARDLHQRMLGAPPVDERYEIAYRLVYARELGGDYYSFNEVGEGLLFCVGDISGKGAAAALFTATLNESVAEAVAGYHTLAEVVATVNRRLLAMMPPTMFVTMFFGMLNAKGLTYSNAGHVPPLLYRTDTQDVTELAESHSTPLGIGPEPRPEPAWSALGPGDMLLVVTDGVTESPTVRHDLAVLRKTFLASAASGPEIVADRVRDLALGTQSAPRDDITILCIRRRDLSKPTHVAGRD